MSNEIEIVIKTDDQTKPGVQSVEKQADRLKTTLKSVGTTAAGILGSQLISGIATRLGDVFHSTVQAASGLNESVNAVNKVFGTSAGEIQAWGKQNAASFGLSQRAFNELATPLGAGLKNAGLSLQDTSKWTIDLTKRASDMASVFNTSVPEALEAIQAGLRGESDPLERYGVGLSAAATQAEALAMTHKKAADELTNTELATARLNLIMKQTSSTAGDFASTSDQYANAQRIAAARIEDAQAKIGAGLLPVMGKLAVVTGDVASGFAALPGPLQAMAVAALAGGAAFVFLGPKVKAAKENLDDLRSGALAADTRLGAMARNAGKVAAGLAAVQVASQALGHDSTAGIDTATKALRELASGADSTSEVTKHLNYDLGTLRSDGLSKVDYGVASTIESLTGLGNVFDESMTHAGQRIGALDAALAAMVGDGNADQAAKAFARLADQAREQGISLDDLKAGFPEYANALDGAATAADKSTGATKKNTAALDENTESVQKNADMVLGLRSDQRGYEAAIDAASDALKKNGKTLNIHTAAGRENLAALDGIADSTWAWVGSMRESGQSTAAQNKVLAAGRQQLIATAQRLGMTRAEASRYADQVLRIPKTATTTIRIRDLASGQLSAVMERIGWINGHPARVRVLTSSANVREGRSATMAHGGISGAASGGVRDGLTLVGEDGPELVDLAPGSQVHSNPDSARMAAASGGGHGPAGVQRIELVVSGADREFTEFLRKVLRTDPGAQAAIREVVT